MKRIHAMIVDDEANSIRNLEQLLQRYCPDVAVVATAGNIEDAGQAIHSLKPDLLFLDIEMPFGDGFELLDRIAGQPVDVIFTTAFDAYAVKAFRNNATDYLLKPVDVDQLMESVEKVKRKRTGASAARAEQQVPVSTHKIMLPSVSGFELMETDQIMYLQSSGNYTHVYVQGGRKYVLSKNIGELEKLLPAHAFLRIHNEHIVNVHEIARYVKGRGGYVILKNNQHLDVSFRRKKLLLEMLGH